VGSLNPPDKKMFERRVAGGLKELTLVSAGFSLNSYRR
jgi:hypothetical protein